MALGGVNIGQELLNVSMGDMIRSMALAIAEAQWALDKSSMVVTELMSGQRLLRDLDSGKLLDKGGKETTTPTIIDSRVYFGYTYNASKERVPNQLSMIELGFVPTFYQFVETIIEVKISISIHGSTENTTNSQNNQTNAGYWWYGNHTVSTAQVNAAYSNKFSYDVTGSSFLRTKLVPVPPPAVLEARIRELMDIERQYLESDEGKKNAGKKFR